MSRVALIVLMPRKGETEELIALLKKSMVSLRQLGVSTDKDHILARSVDGSIIHIFEWANESSQDMAAENDEVRSLWMEAAKLSDFQKPMELKEFSEVFPSFEIIS